MRPARDEDAYSFFIGVSFSFIAHLIGAIVVIFLLERSAASAARAPEIFSVTLEGGEVLGGVAQVPKSMDKIKPPPPGSVPEQEEATEESPKAEEPKKKVEIEKPTVVDAAEEEKKKAEAQKKKLAAEKKKKERERKKKLEAKKKAEAEKKRKADLAKKKKADERKRRAKEKKERDKRLAAIASKLRSGYEGESADVGGTGFGAAKLGGSGMGGGSLVALEKLAYANELQAHVKSGWRWLRGRDKLRALVIVRILPSGQIQDIRIDQSSGNSNFDDSVVRAVRKASPVPPPPEKFYRDFSSVRFWFDSHED